MSQLPGSVREEVEAALGRRWGRTVGITGARSSGGGCIHHALSLDTTAGPVFLKWNRGDAGAAFCSEARSLDALGEAVSGEGVLRVPEVLGARDAEAGEAGWLALEFLPPSRPAPGYERRLGQGLAALHARSSGDAFGWSEDNRIGSLEQANPRTGEWPEFWREARLRPQLDGAFAEGKLTAADRGWAEEVLASVSEALAPVNSIPPALLHGDLWSGNVHAGPDGIPVLLDPATYLGQGEVDLAMMELFGGFHEETFCSYRASLPSPPGYSSTRRPLYQLYYLLVHVRLFGAGYLGGTRAAAHAVLGSLR